VAFNLSHSRGLALLAFTVGEVVGVDVERHRGVRDRDALVRRFFHRREARLLLRLHPEAREGAFFRCWTRKEAVLKAAGLSVALHSGSVALLSRRTLRELWPRQPAVRLAHGLLPGGLRLHWTDLPVGEGCSGAVAYSGPRAAVSLRLFGFGDRGECRDSGAVDTFG
jgi:4'-phosphopantetheinyl transferase